MYFGQPVVNGLREFLPDEAIPPIKMDGKAPLLVTEELKYLGSMLSKNFDEPMTTV
jgi:hypothetical protein